MEYADTSSYPAIPSLQNVETTATFSDNSIQYSSLSNRSSMVSYPNAALDAMDDESVHNENASLLSRNIDQTISINVSRL